MDLSAFLGGYVPPEVCICGQKIPDTAIYYGFPLSSESDEPMAFVNEWHDHCLGEWGWQRSNDDFGIEHVHYQEQAA